MDIQLKRGLLSSTYQVDNKFDDISLKTDVEDIIFIPSDDGKCRVVCNEPKNVKATVSVQGKRLLSIQRTTKRRISTLA